MTIVCPDRRVTVERLVLFGPAPVPSRDAIRRLVGQWVAANVPPALAERIGAWERAHPLHTAVVSRADLPDLRALECLALAGSGPREVARIRSATHAVCLQARTTVAGDGLAGLVAAGRAVGRAVAGVVVDARTLLVRPVDEHDRPLDRLPPDEIASIRSVPGVGGVLSIRTVGMRNLGLPEIAIDGAGRDRDAARRLVAALRDALLARLAEGEPGPIELPWLEVPELGRVPLSTRADGAIRIAGDVDPESRLRHCGDPQPKVP